MRKAREQELKYLREAIAQYQVTPVDTKWVATEKVIEGEPMQIRSRLVARKFQSDDRPDLHPGTPSIGAAEDHNICRSTLQRNFSIVHIDARAYFHAKAQRLVVVRLPVEDRTGTDARKIGLLKKSMYGWHTGRGKQSGA